MKRRRFIERVCATSIAWPVVVRAQTTEKRRRIAIVHTGIPVDKLTETAGLSWIRQLFAELRRLGHTEGPGFAVERYSAEGHSDRYADLAALVVRTAPEVIVTNSSELTKVIARTTTTIPIVAITSDPIETGLVSSIARPGGNLTGVSIEAGVGIMRKRLQILKEAIPGVAHAAFLSRGAQNDGVESSLLDAGRILGIAITFKRLAEITDTQIRIAFAEMAQQRFDAVVVDTQGSFLANRAVIVAMAESHRLPAMYPFRDFVELGGLMAYAPDFGELAKRLANNVHQILAGTNPGEIPYYLPTKFDLVVNLKTAKALGISMPAILLAQADEVIE